MQKAEKRLTAILKRAKSSGISPEKLLDLDAIKAIYGAEKSRKGSKRWNAVVLVASIGMVVSLVFFYADSECLLEMPSDGSKIFRESETCQLCANVDQVDRVKNISPTDFEELYASKGRPVVVTDGTAQWSAIDTFSFDFFKALYRNTSDGDSRTECQFFPYKTEFRSLEEALNMSDERARLDANTKPWYIGWSNCNDKAGQILSQHYERPYFLPESSENMALSWIFMGGPGHGAHMHVDNVRYPSWQAQLRGSKVWRLAPPPECYYRCSEIQVTVKSGEIIVVDTNRWYHQTHILPGDISITIGSEFD